MGNQTTATGTFKMVDISAHSQGASTMEIDTGSATFTIGRDASPLEYLLGSLAACFNVIGHLVAKEMDLVIHDLDVDVEGDIDTAKYQGTAPDTRAGFQTIRVAVTVDADATMEELHAWVEAVEDRCPVADNLGRSADLETTIERA